MTELKPCPFCKCDYLSVHVYRSGVSFILCENPECGAKIELDMHSCSDTPTGRLIDCLVERWNRRVSE